MEQPREHGPSARIPGNRAWRRGMRASGPRSRRRPPRVVPSPPRRDAGRVLCSHGTAPGSAGRWPASPGTAPGGAECGPAVRAPGAADAAGCSLASAARRRPGSLFAWNSPGERGPLARIPGNRARRRECGPAVRAPGAADAAGCSLASAARRRPGSLFAWNSPGERGPLARIPGNRAWRRECGPAVRGPGAADAAGCSLASAARRRPGSLFAWNSPGDRGPLARIPGNRAWRRGMRASGPRSRRRRRRGLFPRLRGAMPAGFSVRMEQPRERGPSARIPGNRAWRRGMRASGPRSPTTTHPTARSTRDLAIDEGPSIPWHEPLVGSGLSLARFSKLVVRTCGDS